MLLSAGKSLKSIHFSAVAKEKSPTAKTLRAKNTKTAELSKFLIFFIFYE